MPNEMFFQSAAAVVEEGQGHVPEAEPQGSEVSWFEAVKDQQINKVKELIEKGSNLNETDEVSLMLNLTKYIFGQL